MHGGARKSNQQPSRGILTLEGLEHGKRQRAKANSSLWRLDDDIKCNDQSKDVEKQLPKLTFSKNYRISLMV